MRVVYCAVIGYCKMTLTLEDAGSPFCHPLAGLGLQGTGWGLRSQGARSLTLVIPGMPPICPLIPHGSGRPPEARAPHPCFLYPCAWPLADVSNAR